MGYSITGFGGQTERPVVNPFNPTNKLCLYFIIQS